MPVRKDICANPQNGQLWLVRNAQGKYMADDEWSFVDNPCYFRGHEDVVRRRYQHLIDDGAELVLIDES